MHAVVVRVGARRVRGVQRLLLLLLLLALFLGQFPAGGERRHDGVHLGAAARRGRGLAVAPLGGDHVVTTLGLVDFGRLLALALPLHRRRTVACILVGLAKLPGEVIL
eukprot:scaffold1556_cov278-Prasinococcus_capsulatus_cf.AAC.7